MQYPYAQTHNNNGDVTRNKMKLNNIENQSRDLKESSGDFNAQTGNLHDIGKSDDNITNVGFGMSNIQGPKQQQSMYNNSNFRHS